MPIRKEFSWFPFAWSCSRPSVPWGACHPTCPWISRALLNVVDLVSALCLLVALRVGGVNKCFIFSLVVSSLSRQLLNWLPLLETIDRRILKQHTKFQSKFFTCAFDVRISLSFYPFGEVISSCDDKSFLHSSSRQRAYCVQPPLPERPGNKYSGQVGRRLIHESLALIAF